MPEEPRAVWSPTRRAVRVEYLEFSSSLFPDDPDESDRALVETLVPSSMAAGSDGPFVTVATAFPRCGPPSNTVSVANHDHSSANTKRRR
jgi:hypothetical protein